VEKLKIVMSKLGIPVFCVPGFEADDLAGTISAQCTMRNVQCVIITGDKDYMQLVNENVRLYMPQKGLSDGEIIDREKIKERLGVWPEQVVDYKGLVGDSSDNYPGVTGVGPKTAIKLLEEFGSFENIYKALKYKALNSKSEILNKSQILNPKLIQRLVDGYEGGRLSKELATIKQDCPISFDMETAKIPSNKMIVEILRELGYKSLIKRMTGDPTLPVATLGTQGDLFERIDNI
jgi:DNA polymerase-1